MNDAIISVSIGGNVKGKPMSNSDWCVYQERARLIIESSLSKKVTFEQYGKSEWLGVSERSRTYNVLSPSGFPPHDVEVLKGRLGYLVHVYGQDAIGFTYGESELITPNHRR